MYGAVLESLDSGDFKGLEGDIETEMGCNDAESCLLAGSEEFIETLLEDDPETAAVFDAAKDIYDDIESV
jgi:hypothetical protein